MKYNGIDPTKLHRGISIAKEIPPGTIDSQLETLKGSSGETIAGRTPKSSEYIVRVNISGVTRAEAWDIRAILAEWACPLDEVTHELIPSHWPRRAYDAIFKEISPPEFVFGKATVDVIFTVTRAVAHDIAKRQSKKADTDGTGVKLGVNVLGTTYIHPTITVKTKAVQRLELGDGVKTWFAVNYDFAEGDVLQVQTDVSAVKISHAGGELLPADRYVDYIATDLDEMCKHLLPGLRTIQSAQAQEITAVWRDEYL